MTKDDYATYWLGKMMDCKVRMPGTYTEAELRMFCPELPQEAIKAMAEKKEPK
jgi:hypothetical protein